MLPAKTCGGESTTSLGGKLTIPPSRLLSVSVRSGAHSDYSVRNELYAKKVAPVAHYVGCLAALPPSGQFFERVTRDEDRGQLPSEGREP